MNGWAREAMFVKKAGRQLKGLKAGAGSIVWRFEGIEDLVHVPGGNFFCHPVWSPCTPTGGWVDDTAAGAPLGRTRGAGASSDGIQHEGG